MKWISNLFYFLIICCSMASCIETEFNAKDIMEMRCAKNGHTWYQFKHNDKYGICDIDGNVLTTPRYDIIQYNSRGDYYILRQVRENEKDTLIAIETKTHEKKILLEQGVIKYTRVNCLNGDKFYYKVTVKKGNQQLYGIYDKNWNVIMPPIMDDVIFYRGKHLGKNEFVENPKYEGEGVERFWYEINRGSVGVLLPLPICLNAECEVVCLKDKIEYMNIYEKRLYSDTPTRIFVSFMIYRDYILEPGSKLKYAYWETDEDQKLYGCYITSPNGNRLAHKLFLNNNYDLASHNTYIQQYDFNGDPLIWSYYDDIKEKFDEYKNEYDKMLSKNTDEDAVYLILMKKSVNDKLWNKNIDEDRVGELFIEYKKERENEVNKLKKIMASARNYLNINTLRGRKRVQNTFNYDINKPDNYNNNNNDDDKEPQKIVVEQKRQPVSVQVWIPCPTCRNSGQCQTCYGQGWTYSASDRYYDGKAPCYNCGGSKKCTTCAGQGGHYEVEYR